MKPHFPHALKAMRNLSRVDPRIETLIKAVGPMRVELDATETVFESLASSIVYQQLHGKAAATILARWVSSYGLKAGEFPSPKKILATPIERLRACGLSQAKSLAILDLAFHASEGRIPERAEAEKMSDLELIDIYSAVRGIGRWTVEMFLIFTLGRTDVWPVHDYGVRKGFAAVFRKKAMPTPKDLEKLGNRFSPYRSAAAWYFWRALELPQYAPKHKAKPKKK